MPVRSLAIVAAAALVASCTAHDNAPVDASAAAPERDCFFLSQISGYSDAGRDTIHVSVGPSRTYEFKTFGACPELKYSEGLAFDKKGPGTICRGMDVDLIVPTSIGPRRCAVSMIRRLPKKVKD